MADLQLTARWSLNQSIRNATRDREVIQISWYYTKTNKNKPQEGKMTLETFYRHLITFLSDEELDPCLGTRRWTGKINLLYDTEMYFSLRYLVDPGISYDTESHRFSLCISSNKRIID